jgi:hypothetical protein
MNKEWEGMGAGRGEEVTECSKTTPFLPPLMTQGQYS